MTSTININSLKKLCHYSTGAVVHLCRSAARIYGKLALIEQLTYEDATGDRSDIEHVLCDKDELRREVCLQAHDCAKTLIRLNTIAAKHDIPLPMRGLDELTLSELVESLNNYVASLVAESDYREWLRECCGC